MSFFSKLFSSGTKYENLPYDRHVKSMIVLGGKAAKGDRSACKTLQKMAKGNDWERRLSLYACFTSKDGERVLAATQDHSDRVRCLAYRVATHACDDQYATKVLQRAWEVRRHMPLLKRLYNKKRSAVIDAYILWLDGKQRVRDIVDAAPFASKDIVRKYWDIITGQPSAILWQRLTIYQPEIMAEYLCDRIRLSKEEPDPVDRQLIDRHLTQLADRAPFATIKLVEEMLIRQIFPPYSVWKILARRVPQKIIPYLKQHKQLRYGYLFQNVMMDASALEDIIAIDVQLLGEPARLYSSLSNINRVRVANAWAKTVEHAPKWGYLFLKHIEDPTLLAHATKRWCIAMRGSSGIINSHLLEELPLQQAEEEAKHQLHEVIALRTEPAVRMQYICFLDWEEAIETSKIWLGHPEGEMRGRVLSSLMKIPGRRPERTELVPKALKMMIDRKFEQDPVRRNAFAALMSWPKEIWKPEHLSDVGQMIRDALDAADLSPTTASYAENLVVRLFSIDSEWASVWLSTLVKERGMMYNHRIGADLNEKELRRVGPALMVIAKKWFQSDDHNAIVHLGQSLKSRIHCIEGFADLLLQTALISPWFWTKKSIFVLLNEYAPEHMGVLLQRLINDTDPDIIFTLAQTIESELPPGLIKRLKEIALSRLIYKSPIALRILRHKSPEGFNDILKPLLTADRSFILLPVIHHHIHRRRHDLLDFLLDETAVEGCLATGKTQWVIPFEDGFFRWPFSQIARYEKSLERIMNDDDGSTPKRLQAMTILANLFSVSAKELCAAASSPTPVIQERAIRILSRLDAGQGIPVLLSCLRDKRARFAIYGLRKAILKQPASRAVEFLKDVAMYKVTVAKEVVRLLGEIRHEDAYQRLVQLANGDLHRDVRMAMLRALWDHLEREPTWEIMEAAATGEDILLATKVGNIPADRLTKASDIKLSALLSRVLNRPEPEVRIELLHRAYFLAIRDHERRFWKSCVRRLRSLYDNETKAAMRAVLLRSFESDHQFLESALCSLREDPRSLSIAMNTLFEHDLSRRKSWGLLAIAARNACATPYFRGLEMRCVIAERAPLGLADWIASRPELDFEAMHAAQEAFISMSVSMERHYRGSYHGKTSYSNMSGPDILAVAVRLQDSLSVESRRLAVIALERCVLSDQGWTPECLALLELLQADQDPRVSGPAQLIFPPREAVSTTVTGADPA